MLKRTLSLALAVFSLATVCSAGTDPFIGKWKLNPSRSQLADQMSIQIAGKNMYTLKFSGSEQTETVTADGTEQPGLYGTTVSVTVEKSGTWKIVRKNKGQMVLSAVWNLSSDGKTLSDAFTSYQPDGTTSLITMKYRRASGGTGIPGTWESTEVKLGAVYELEIRPFDGDGLSFITPSSPAPKNMKFDGKEYRNLAGAGVTTASAGRRKGPLGLEITDRVEGKILDTRRMTLSPDRKTLTTVVHVTGQRLPNVLVFDRV